MPPKNHFILGNNTPIAFGIVLTILVTIAGFSFQAGAINKNIDGLNQEISDLKAREIKNARSQVEMLTKLSRIETLLEEMRRR